jgi:hypothetical protein
MHIDGGDRIRLAPEVVARFHNENNKPSQNRGASEQHEAPDRNSPLWLGRRQTQRFVQFVLFVEACHRSRSAPPLEQNPQTNQPAAPRHCRLVAATGRVEILSMRKQGAGG